MRHVTWYNTGSLRTGFSTHCHICLSVWADSLHRNHVRAIVSEASPARYGAQCRSFCNKLSDGMSDRNGVLTLRSVKVLAHEE
jgi:hypothetical protein